MRTEREGTKGGSCVCEGVVRIDACELRPHKKKPPKVANTITQPANPQRAHNDPHACYPLLSLPLFPPLYKQSPYFILSVPKLKHRNAHGRFRSARVRGLHGSLECDSPPPKTAALPYVYLYTRSDPSPPL